MSRTPVESVDQSVGLMRAALTQPDGTNCALTRIAPLALQSQRWGNRAEEIEIAMPELSAQLNSAQQQATHLLLGVMRAARSTVLESGGGSAGKALSAVCAEGLEIVRAYSAWRSEIGRRRSFERRFLDDAARHVLRSANSYSRTIGADSLVTLVLSAAFAAVPAVARLLVEYTVGAAHG